MAESFPRLTLFLGPPTRHGRAMNDIVRAFRDQMIPAGLHAHQNWIAMKALRNVAGAADPRARQYAFAGLVGDAPSFYSAMSFFGSARKGLNRGELFPDAMNQLAGIAGTPGEQPRLVVALDPVPDLFMAEASVGVDEAIRSTPWDALYELSWIDLIESLRASFPRAEILCLTHRGMALGGAGLLRRLFGPAADAVGERTFLREALSATGRAVLERMPGSDAVDEGVASEMYESFALGFTPDEYRERLGLDRLTLKLLSQRFDEDLAEMRGIGRVEVI